MKIFKKHLFATFNHCKRKPGTLTSETGKPGSHQLKTKSGYSVLVPILLGVFISAVPLVPIASGRMVGIENTFAIFGTFLFLIFAWSAISIALFSVPGWRPYSKFVVPIPILLLTLVAAQYYRPAIFKDLFDAAIRLLFTLKN